MKIQCKLALVLFGLSPLSVWAATHYVALDSPNPTPPYTNWATAATDIQDAVDAAGAGDEIVVTNGTYAPVTVSTALTLQSVNCPSVTVIDGGGWEECVYLTNNAVMVGFTLTNGSAGNGGGVYCASTSAVLSNCVLSGNSAYNGGGAYGGTLNNCTLSGNSAQYGNGGGAYGGTLNNCTLSGNSAYYGGGAEFSTLDNCTLTDNSAWDGGGANGGTLNNCTLTGNSADDGGGGAYSCTLNNCIVYFNSDPNDGGNYDSFSTLNYCCTTPLPTSGAGNISADPQLASASYLSPYSPCVGAGSAAYASGTDIDGEPWANPPSMGCEEFYADTMIGPLSVAIAADYTNVTTGFPVGLTASIGGRTDLSVWDFGDGTVLSNRPYASHAWAAMGDYPVTLRAYNDSQPAGVAASVTIHVIVPPVFYVTLNSTSSVPPYGSWATAATNIQDAVNAASVPGTVVLVSNGVYQGGLNVAQPLTVRSVNGPDLTVIDGGGTNECVYLTNDAVLVGFTLTNGWAFYGSGGGVYCESTSAVLTNCALIGNSAYGDGGGAYGGTLNNCTLTGNLAHKVGSGLGTWGGSGGGAYNCTLNGCTLSGNSAAGGGGSAGYSPGVGGGACFCTLNNCTLTGNSASDDGGGAYSCTLNNCIVYFNTDPNDGGNYDSSSTLNYCCTTPLPDGIGNIINAPLFVNYASGNLRLQSNSPCINSGNNAYVVGNTDLDGNPRIVGGTVDIGAYEYQTPVSMISYAWLQHYGLPISTNVDTADLDGTGMNVYQDWIAGLNPTNALSVLKMTSATPATNAAGLVVTWESVNTRTYFLQCSTNLAAQPAFITIRSNIAGRAGTTSYTDTTATNAGPYFYRVEVGQ
jgi:hypothetical protein